MGELDWYIYKKETRPPTYTIHRINSKWIKDLNVSDNTMKVLVENIGSKISDIPHSNIFANKFHMARKIKEKK